MKFVDSKSYHCSIYIAGDISTIKRVCRRFCYKVGFCVTVTQTEYIYTGGLEKGAIIGIINYPRFAKTNEEILSTATELANILLKECSQHSYTIETPDTTYWHSLRKD